MKINEFIKILKKIESEEGNITICTYDSVLENYSENVCLETVEDYYMNFMDDQSYGKILLL